MKPEELRQAGFTDTEINSYILDQSETLKTAGFSDKEINDYFGTDVAQVKESHYQQVYEEFLKKPPLERMGIVMRLPETPTQAGNRARTTLNYAVKNGHSLDYVDDVYQIARLEKGSDPADVDVDAIVQKQRAASRLNAVREMLRAKYGLTPYEKKVNDYYKWFSERSPLAQKILQGLYSFDSVLSAGWYDRLSKVLGEGDFAAMHQAIERYRSETNPYNEITGLDVAHLVGTAGAIALQFRALPNALGASGQFAVQAALQAPTEGYTPLGHALDIGKAALMGQSIKWATRLWPSVWERAPMLSAAFYGLGRLEGQTPTEAVQQAMMVPIFEAIGFMQAGRSDLAVAKIIKEKPELSTAKPKEILDELRSVTEVYEELLYKDPEQRMAETENPQAPVSERNKPQDKITNILSQIDYYLKLFETPTGLKDADNILYELERLDAEYEILKSLPTKSVSELHVLAKKRGIDVPKGTTKTGLIRLIRGEDVELARLNREAKGKTIEATDNGYTVWTEVSKNQAGSVRKGQTFKTLEEARNAMLPEKPVKPSESTTATPPSVIAPEPPIKPSPIVEVSTEASGLKTNEVVPAKVDVKLGETPNIAKTPELQQMESGKVPSEKMPVPSEGPKVESQSKVLRQIMKDLEGHADIDPSYNRMSIAQDAARAIKFVTENTNDARNVVVGYKAPPEGITDTAIRLAYLERAKLNGEWGEVVKAANSIKLTNIRKGQEVAANKGAVNEHSAQHFINQVIDARMTMVGEKTVSANKKATRLQKVKETIDNEVAKLKKELSKKQIDIQEAQKILDDLIC